MSAWHAFWLDERGGPAAEMALMLPLLMALLFGGMEGGFFFWREHQIVKVAREGARYGARQSMANFKCSDGSVSTDVKTKIETMVASNLAGTTTVTAKTVTPCITGSSTGLYAGRTAGETGAPILVVNLTQNYRGIFATMILPSDMQISATAQSAVMGL